MGMRKISPAPWASRAAAEPEDDTALVLPQHLDRGAEHEDDEDRDDGDDDQGSKHRVLSEGRSGSYVVSGVRRRGEPEPQAVLDVLHDHRVAGRERLAVCRLRLPELALDRHEAAAPHDARRTDEARCADGDRLAPYLDDLGDGEGHEERHRAGDRDRHRQRHLVRIARGVEEQQGAEDERHGSRQRERAVAHHERFRRPEPGSEQHQQHSRPVDGQHLEPVEADDEADAAERRGEDQAGVVELDDDPEHAEREHQGDDVRVDQRVEDALPQAHLDLGHLGAGRVEDEAARHGLHAVDLVEQARAGSGR